MRRKKQTILSSGPPQPSGNIWFNRGNSTITIKLQNYKEQFNFNLHCHDFTFNMSADDEVDGDITVSLNDIEVQEPRFEIGWLTDYDLEFHGYGYHRKIVLKQLNITQDVNKIYYAGEVHPFNYDNGNRTLEIRFMLV